MRENHLRASRRAQLAVVGLSILGTAGAATAIGLDQANATATGGTATGKAGQATTAHQRSHLAKPQGRLTSAKPSNRVKKPAPTKQAPPPPTSGTQTTTSGS